MTSARPIGAGLAPLVAVVALGALWPLSAYLVAPAVLPLLVFGVAVGAVVVSRPEYGLALVVALSPLTNLSVPGLGGAAKPIQAMIPMLVFALLGWGIVAFRRRDRLVRTSGLAVPVALFGAVALASSLQAISPSAAINKLLLVFTACALFLAVVHICRDRRSAMVVVVGCVVALLIGGLHGVGQQVLGLVGEAGFVADGEIIARVQGSFGHPNQYAGFVALLIPLALCLMLTRQVAPGLRLLCAAAVVFGLAGLTLSYTRGAVIGLVAGGLLWLAFLRPRAAVIAVLLVAVATVTVAPATLKDRFTGGESSDVGLRQDLWGSALDIYGESPVLGVGLSNFKEGYARLPASLANASQRRLLHNRQILIPPHAANLYLNVLA